MHSPGIDGLNLDQLRKDTPGVDHCIHLNNCGAALMPAPVIAAVDHHLALEARIGGYEAEEQAEELIGATYQSLARMLSCSPQEIALVENATRAWDMIFYSLEFKPGQRILTSRAEYASNYIAFLQVAQRTGALVEAVPDDSSGTLDLDALREMLDEQVALIAITHVPTGGGLINPAAGVGALARAAGIPFLLDACQSAGQMPLNVDDLQVDFLTATSRKFLRGPRGVGFLYVRKPWIEKLEPPFLDLLAADWVSEDRYQIRKDARRFETWESFVAGRIGLGVAVDYALELGLDAIQTRVTGLAECLRQGLSQIAGITVQDQGHSLCAICTFSHTHISADQVKQRLRAAELGALPINVSTSSILSTRLNYSDRNLTEVVRAAVHYYNSEQEIAQVLEALAKISSHQG